MLVRAEIEGHHEIAVGHTWNFTIGTTQVPMFVRSVGQQTAADGGLKMTTTVVFDVDDKFYLKCNLHYEEKA